MVDKINYKLRSEVKGLYVKNGSYFLERMINRERLRTAIGKVGDVTKEQAEENARELIARVKEFGVASVKEMGSITRLKYKNETLNAVVEDYIEIGSKHGTR